METTPAALLSVMLIVIIITPVFATGPVVLLGDEGTSPSMIFNKREQALSKEPKDG